MTGVPATIAKNVSAIQATWGSVRNWLTRQREIKDKVEQEQKAYRDRVDRLVETTENLAEQLQAHIEGGKAQENALKYMLYYRFRAEVERWEDQGYISLDDLEFADDLYQQLEDLGMNGHATALIRRVHRLPSSKGGYNV